MFRYIRASYNRLLDYKTQLLQSMEDFLDQCLLEIWEFITFQTARLFRTIFFVFSVLILACAVVHCYVTFVIAFAELSFWFIDYFNMDNFILYLPVNTAHALYCLYDLALCFDHMVLAHLNFLDEYTTALRYLIGAVAMLLLYLLFRWFDDNDN